jgi:hypothetical protein
MVPATARYLIICMFLFFLVPEVWNRQFNALFFAQVATAREDMEVAMVVVTGAVTAATVVARAATAARAATEVVAMAVDRAAMEQPRAATVERPAATAVLRVVTALPRAVTELHKVAASVQVISSTVPKSVLRNRLFFSVLVPVPFPTFEKVPVRFWLRI